MTQYVIKSGDTLYSVARRFGITVEQLLAANPHILNPDKIYPGQSLIIPSTSPPPGMLLYPVVSGDTLFSIAQRYGSTVAVLLRLNPEITNASLIYPGQQIRVPLPPPPAIPGCIVSVSTRTGTPELWRSSASGEKPVQLTGKGNEAQRLYDYPAPKWSPDGRRIAFLAMSGENRILYVMGPCGKARTAVTSQDTGSFSWSPDSTMIAYSNSGGTFAAAPGGTAKKVTDRLSAPQWFPDGKRLAGNTSVEGVNYAVLATVDLSGQNFKVFDSPPIPAGLVRVSPDGRYAAMQFQSGSAYSVVSSVSIYDFATGNFVRLPGAPIETEPGVTRDLNTLGGWSPDSSMLVYSTLVNPQGYSEVKIVSPAGAPLKSFGRGFYAYTGWGPSLDWVTLTLSENPGSDLFQPTLPQNIYMLNIRTGRQIKITSTGSNAFPDWIGKACPACN